MNIEPERNWSVFCKSVSYLYPNAIQLLSFDRFWTCVVCMCVNVFFCIDWSKVSISFCWFRRKRIMSSEVYPVINFFHSSIFLCENWPHVRLVLLNRCMLAYCIYRFQSQWISKKMFFNANIKISYIKCRANHVVTKRSDKQMLISNLWNILVINRSNWNYLPNALSKLYVLPRVFWIEKLTFCVPNDEMMMIFMLKWCRLEINKVIIGWITSNKAFSHFRLNDAKPNERQTAKITRKKRIIRSK